MQSSSSRGFAWGFGGAPCTGPQTLGMGTFPPFAEAQQMVKQLAARSQALLVGLGMDKSQAMVSHQPPLLVCSSIHPMAFLMTVPTESQVVPPAESWHSRAVPGLLIMG